MRLSKSCLVRVLSIGVSFLLIDVMLAWYIQPSITKCQRLRPMTGPKSAAEGVSVDMNGILVTRVEEERSMKLSVR
jgi:hypothetical protein